LTPLHYASKNASDGRIIDILVNHGADVNALDDAGTSPLIHASFRGAFDIVKKLLEHKADVTIKDSTLDTALSVAHEKGFDSIIQLLKEAGARE
jgi:ankyrin repeat protein